MRRLYGRHAVEELLRVAPESVHALLVSEGGEEDALVTLATAAGVAIRYVPSTEMRERGGSRGGTRVAAEVIVAPSMDLEDIQGASDPAPLIVALDGVTDPHNLGAILRSSAAFGAQAVITTRDRSAPLNDAAVRASAGACAHVPLIRVTNLSRALRQLKNQGLWVVTTRVEASVCLWDVDFKEPTVIVLGSEGYGVRPGVAKESDWSVRLPMASKIGSVNVSVCAGVVLSEALRQRNHAENPLD